MPIFWCDVNLVYDEKLVPITRRNSTSIEPTAEAIVLKRVEGVPRIGPSGNVALHGIAWTPLGTRKASDPSKFSDIGTIQRCLSKRSKVGFNELPFLEMALAQVIRPHNPA